MSQPIACLLDCNLESVRLFGEGDALWTASPLSGTSLDTRALRLRAEEAALWTAKQPGVRRRLSMVVVDVEDAICTWLRPPSTAAPVVAAALRAQTQDWGDLLPVASFEPLIDAGETDNAKPRGKRPGKAERALAAEPEGTVAMGVLCLPDALVRLWLDSLDRLGVRIGGVTSLWHAIARAWGGEGGPTTPLTACVLVDDERRLVWSWSRGPELVCGGLVSLQRARMDEQPTEETPAETPGPTDLMGPAGRRLTLDWLTWSSHLGQVPERIVIVGLNAGTLAATLGDRWKSAPITTVDRPDAITRTIEQITSANPEPINERSSSRYAIVRLTRRPTLAMRGRYRWAAATFMAIAVALALLGQRLGNASAKFNAAVLEVRSQTRQDAKKEVPDLPDVGSTLDLTQRLTSALLKTNSEPFQAPPLPRPIYEEVSRLVGILSKYDGIKIINLKLDQEVGGQGCAMQIRTPDRRIATEVFVAIQGTGKPIIWRRQEGGTGANLEDLNLFGTWAEK